MIELNEPVNPPPARDIRAELHAMIVRDLIGPAGGPEEELVERNVRERYLVGVLAPSNAPDDAGADDDDDDDLDVPAIPDALCDDGVDSADDGITDQDVPVAIARFPSSVGLTFCVDAGCDAIRVRAVWGHYRRELSSTLTTDAGAPMRVWERVPVDAAVSLVLKDGPIEALSLHVDFPDVVIRGKIRRKEGHVVVTLFLVNNQTEARPKDEYYVFQPELIVEVEDAAPVFVRGLFGDRAGDSSSSTRLEDDTLAMLYRRHREFAVGHGVGVHWEVDPGNTDRATEVRTRFIPEYNVPHSSTPTAADEAANPAFAALADVELDMKVLASLDRDELVTAITPLVAAYRVWIENQEKSIDTDAGLSEYRVAAANAMTQCRAAADRLEEGIRLLQDRQYPDAFAAFQFMNKAMWLQRTHTIFATQVRRQPEQAPDFERDVDRPGNRSWYPFQLAFILINLPGLTRLDHPDRVGGHQSIADLLFFPTGGGKTEAYLGLTAYTLGLRRLQGVIEGHDGENGVAVLMRYTLRLLTIQQFQRATALICACEDIRRKALESGDERWGRTPFRVGLWVGRKTTPNRNQNSEEAVKQLRGTGYPAGGSGTPHQLTNCPWCGTKINPNQHIEVRPFKNERCRTLVYCGDKFGQCMFSRRNSPDEGLPIIVVDEEIYRRLPSLLIATVDKFAQMPWKGEVQMLFGRVNGKCPRHGFTSPEIADSAHPRTRNGLPSTKIETPLPIRPPDLIIQDELHLISGPLGSLVGLYETAIDKLCTWTVNGATVRPKVIASTATIRNAPDQIYKLFVRRAAVFPPPGLDISDNFFTLQRTGGADHPGRLYLGVCAPGRRLKATLIRVYVAYLCAAQMLYERYGRAADPWMTLAGYFNSTRELGGMRRVVDDDIRSRVQKMDRRGLSKRRFSTGFLEELTSRKASDKIPDVLDRLEAVFDPILEQKRIRMYKRKEFDKAPKKPVDILLATNMISVGVDVPRLGLMVVAGQPKSTAEYIQATSRVGRRCPGLVCTVYNWARPRDLSHYETFEHYHSSFYKHVEPLSVTPFSPGALSRGIAGVLVGMLRLGETTLNANDAAANFRSVDDSVKTAVGDIVSRAELVEEPAVGRFCEDEMKAKADHWQSNAQNITGGRRLTYVPARGNQRASSIPLLTHPGIERWEAFTCLDSLRDVEPTVKLIIADHGLDEFVHTTDADDAPPD